MIIACCFIFAWCELAGSSVEFETEALSCHKNIDSDVYKCTECDERYHDSNELAIHRRSHSGEKPFECSVCSKRFTHAESLDAHNRIHSGEKPYKCHVCDQAFSQLGRLNTHMLLHSEDKADNCSLCINTSFSQSRGLRTHVCCTHSNSRAYLCPYCGKTFKTRCNMNRHVLIHTGEKPYVCGHCSKRFTGITQLKTHLLKSHDGRT